MKATNLWDRALSNSSLRAVWRSEASRRARLLITVALFIASAFTLVPRGGEVALAADTGPQPGDELVELRTEHSKTIMRENGKRETKIWTRPMHFSLAGKWEPVDTSLVRVGASFVSKANSWTVTFGPLATGITIVDSDKAGTITAVPVGASPALPEADGDSVVIYRDAWPNVDLRYTVFSDMVKEDIIVRAPQARTDFSFLITGASLEADQDSPGGYVFGGALGRWRVAPPEVRDNQRVPLPQATSGVHFNLSALDAVSTLKVGVTPAWLESLPSTAYPITIDPTFIVGSSQTIAYYGPGGSCACGVRVGGPDNVSSWRTIAYFPYDQVYWKEIQGANVRVWQKYTGVNYGVIVNEATAWDWPSLGDQLAHNAWNDSTQQYFFETAALRDKYQSRVRPPSGGMPVKFRSDAETHPVNTFGEFWAHELTLYWNDWEPTVSGTPSVSPSTVSDGNSVTFSQGYYYTGETPSVRLYVCDESGFNGGGSGCNGTTYAVGGYTSSGTAAASFTPGANQVGQNKRFYTRVCSSHSPERCSTGTGTNTFTVDNRPPTATGFSRSSTDENGSSSNIDASGEANEGQRLAYNVTWSDPDDPAGAYALLCKTSTAPSGTPASCPGGTWAQGPSTTTGASKASFTTTSATVGTNALWAYACNPNGSCGSAGSGSFTVNKIPAGVTLAKTSPAGNATSGSPITFSVDYADSAGESVKVLLCDTDSPVTPGSTPTCAGRTYNPNPSFTTADPATASFTPLESDRPSRTFYAFVCDDNLACSQGSSALIVGIDNATPTVLSATDSPDPVDSGSSTNFTVSWRDGQTSSGDAVNVYLCRTSTAPTGGDCAGGVTNRFVKTAAETSTSPVTMSYTSIQGDVPSRTYYAFACDGDGACSPAVQGTLGVNNKAPAIGTVTRTPSGSVPSGSTVSFAVNFTEYGGDTAQGFACRTNQAPVSGACPGGSWGAPGAAGGGSSTVSYTTTQADVTDGGPAKDYWAFACDGLGACSAPVQGSFPVNNVAPGSAAAPTAQPSPLPAGSTVAFQLGWSDTGGDTVHLYVCKSNSAPTGGACPGGQWAKSASATGTTPAQASYTTVQADVGTRDYWAFVCDSRSACSTPGRQGNFTVTNPPPAGTSVSDAPDPVNSGSVITFTVSFSEAGGDSASALICRTSVAPTGTTCPGGAWATGPAGSTSSAAPYTAVQADVGLRSYWAYACDQSACTTAGAGSFTVNNRAPTLGSVTRSPSGSLPSGSTVSFTVNFTEHGGDTARAFACKTNQAPTSGSCPGGSWGPTGAAGAASSTVTYTTTQNDVTDGATPKDYWAFACDQGSPNLCSASSPGSFAVTNVVPTAATTPTAMPSPLPSGSTVTFQLGWSDTGGDTVRLFVCRTSAAPTGATLTCPGGQWATSASATGASPASAPYTTVQADVGARDYWAFVCDSRNACSTPARQGSFTVTNAAPTINTASDSPDPVTHGGTVTFSVTFTEYGGDTGRGLICKTSAAPTGGACPGGAWATGPYGASSSTSQHTTTQADVGVNAYWAFSCDASNACSSPINGTFEVESVPPTVPSMPIAQSDKTGFEDFYGYRSFNLGPDTGFVNLATGDLSVTRHDLAIPGQGFNLGMTRTYNAGRSGVDGPLGPGWSFAPADLPTSGVGRGTSILATGTMLAFDDTDGTRHWFLKDAEGWHSPIGVSLVVSDFIDGATGFRVYKVTRPDGVVWTVKRVGSAYHVTNVDDRKGSSLTLGYASGVLTSVTDSTGRKLLITWTAGLVARVRFLPSTGSSEWHDVTYAYTNGRLSSVTDAAGTGDARTTLYEYDGAGRLWKVRDGHSNPNTFQYQSGRLSNLTDRAGMLWRLFYNEGDHPTGAGGAFTVELQNPELDSMYFASSDAGNLVLAQDAGDVDEAGAARFNSDRYVWADNRLRTHVDQASTGHTVSWNELGLVTEAVTSGSGPPFVSRYVWAFSTQTPGAADLIDAFTAAGTPEERRQHFDYLGDTGLVSVATDPIGSTTSFTYYVRGLVRTITDGNGKQTIVGTVGPSDGGYHPSGQPSRIEDPTGAFKTFGYDFLGRVTTTANSTNNTWTQSFDRRGNMLASSTPLGVTKRHCYDANDNKVLDILPHSPSTSCSLSGTDGYSVRYGYDSRDLLLSTTTASKTAASTQIRKHVYNYASDGELTSIDEPMSFDAATGNPVTPKQTATYDRYDNNRARGFIDEEGHRTDVVYTTDGLPSVVTNPPSPNGSRQVTRHGYDEFRRPVTKHVSGHAGSTIYSYNRHGDRIFEASPAMVTKATVYDAAGRVDRSVDGQGRPTDYNHDAIGNLTELVQPTGVGMSTTTRYTYTGRNEIDITTDPADPNHVIDYDYDNMGRQRFRRDRSGTSTNLAARPVVRTTETVYDADGRIVTQDAAFPNTNNGRHRSTYEWNTEGTLRTAKAYEDGSASEFARFDNTVYTSAGELVSWTETLTNTAGVPFSKSGSYGYRQDGLLTSRTIDGNAVTYTHDLRGMPAAAAPWGGGSNYSWNWAPSGAVMMAGLPTGHGVTHAYDAAERISSQMYSAGGSAIAALQNITYDEDDNRTSEQVTQRQADGSTLTGGASYSYDSLGRLRTFKHPFDAEVEAFVLDDAGNVLTDGSSISTYSANRLMSTQELWPTLDPGPPPSVSLPGTTTYDYDNVGNRTADVKAGNMVTYVYDAAGYTTTQGGFNTTGYRYDFSDRLVWQGSNTETRLFFHDGLSEQVALETDDAGTVKTRYVLGPDGAPLANEDATKAGTSGRGHYLSDPRGNVVAMVDGTNVVRATFAYSAYGQGKPTGTSFSAGWDSRLRFQTAPRDPASGKYTLGPRLYDPATYRFVGVDSMLSSTSDRALQVDPLTGNRYLYAGCNPVGLIDDGHGPQKPIPPCNNIPKDAYISPGMPSGSVFTVDQLHSGRLDWNFVVGNAGVRAKMGNQLTIYKGTKAKGDRVLRDKNTHSSGKGWENHGSTKKVKPGKVYTIHLLYVGSNGKRDLTIGIVRVTCRAT